MLKNFIPNTISSRIIALILFILIANAALSTIFSLQYHIHASQTKTIEGLRASANYLAVHGSPENINQVLSAYDVTSLEQPPHTMILTTNKTLNRITKTFNLRYDTQLLLYEDPYDPKVLYIAYKEKRKPTYWLKMPQEPIENTAIMIGYLEEVFILLVILLGSYYTAKKINDPLENIMRSLDAFGKGVIPPSLPEKGPTEMKKLAHSVNMMIQNHHTLTKERELMLAGISHDLRTPLTRLQLLAEMSFASPDIIKEMSEEIEQITKMQQQFIDYISASNQETEDLINLNEFCEDLARKYQVLSHDIKINNKASHELLLKTQPIGLYRLITNGINNAIKYGAPPFLIEIFETDKNIIINIIDHGKGVSDEILTEIFKPLYRGDIARKNADGSGLGLAIVSRIVKRLGGEICAYNVSPHGFCLNIKLPVSVT